MNLFSAITSGIGAYNALSNTQTGQNLIGQAKQTIAPITQPLQKAFTPTYETAKSAASPITNIIGDIAKPIVKSAVFQRKTQDYYAPFKSEIEKIGITYDDLAELPEEEKQQVVSQLKQIGVQIPGLVEAEQATQQQQATQGEDLGIMGNIGEGIIGAFRAGEQIPRIAGAGMGYLTQNVTGPLIAGGLDLVGADTMADKWRAASKKTGEGFKSIGEDITRAGEGDITEKQRTARRFGGEMALTAPIGGGYLAGAKGVGGLALRSGVVGAGFGATQPIIDKGGQATVGDIATGAAVGGALGAVATPVIGKVLKYGQAGYRGGLTGMGKSITRDIKSGVNAITPSGANISTKANRFNANEIREFTKTTGQSPGDFATSRGMTKVGDDAVVEATNLWQKSKDQADEALKAIKGRFRFTDEGEDLLKTTIDDLETRLVNTKSPDSKRISQLKAKYEDSGLTMSEINEVKRAYSNNYKYSFVDAGSESAIRSRNLQDAVRKWQFKVAEENGLTNLKEINKTTQGWKMFADSLSKKIQGSSGNNNVSLTDWIALSGGSPENIALYLGKKLASSDKVKSGAIKLFSKKTKPSIIQASKADIQRANFQKDVNRGVSGAGDRSGGESLVKPVGLLPAPTGKATGAKNFRVNQPKEAPTQKSDITSKSKIVRPGTKTTTQQKQEVILAKQVERNKYLKDISDDIASSTKAAQYGGTGTDRVKTKLNSLLEQGKITREEAIDIAMDAMENKKYSYIDKKQMENYLNDLYSNKKIESFDDLLNEKQVAKEVKTPRQEFLETPEGIYSEINKKANDRRFNPEKANALIAKFKEKTGIDLMKNPMQKFDEKGNVVRTIVKPNTIKNESKVNKPKSSDTIPEGYIENAFGEIQKNPSNKKVSPKAPIDKPMIQLLDEKTPGYIKNSLELAQSPTTMGRYISEILGKDIKNVSVKDISEFYKKYGPFPKWEKRLQDGVTGYEKGRMPGMSENGYKQDKLLLKAFYQSKSLTPQSNAKQQVIKPTSSDTIPEGYFKNAFGEIQKNPSNKKGGFIKIPELGKKSGDMETKKLINTSLIKDEYKKRLRDMFINKKDGEKLGTVIQVIQNKELLDMMPESVKYMDIWVDSKYLDNLGKQTGGSIFAAYKQGKGNFPGAISIRANVTPKELAEEILHAIRFNKGRSMNKPEGYDKVQSIYENSLFEKTAKKGAEYFGK